MRTPHRVTALLLAVASTALVGCGIPTMRTIPTDVSAGGVPWAGPRDYASSKAIMGDCIVTGRSSTYERCWVLPSGRKVNRRTLEIQTMATAESSGLMSHYTSADSLTLVCLDPMVVIGTRTDGSIGTYDPPRPRFREGVLISADPAPRASIFDKSGAQMVDLRTDEHGMMYVPVRWGRLVLVPQTGVYRIEAVAAR